LIGVDGTAADEGGEAVVADAKVISGLLARQDIGVWGQISKPNSVMATECPDAIFGPAQPGAE
jgi:hypothetical protein